MAPNFESLPNAAARRPKPPAEQPVYIVPPYRRVPVGLEPPTDIIRPMREGTALSRQAVRPVMERLVTGPDSRHGEF